MLPPLAALLAQPLDLLLELRHLCACLRLRGRVGGVREGGREGGGEGGREAEKGEGRGEGGISQICTGFIDNVPLAFCTTGRANALQ